MIHYLRFEPTKGLSLKDAKPVNFVLASQFRGSFAFMLCSVLSVCHNSRKTNVFGIIFESACVSVCQSVCTSAYKILVILRREIPLQFCFKCIKTLHIQKHLCCMERFCRSIGNVHLLKKEKVYLLVLRFLYRGYHSEKILRNLLSRLTSYVYRAYFSEVGTQVLYLISIGAVLMSCSS